MLLCAALGPHMVKRARGQAVFLPASTIVGNAGLDQLSANLSLGSCFELWVVALALGCHVS